MINRRALITSAAAAALVPSMAKAQKRYGPGTSDTEIVFGSTQPFSGGAAAYSSGMKVADAFFKQINSQGGVNGRRLRFVMLDDAYAPPRTVEQTRKLVEEEKVAFLFSSVGTAPQIAVRQYLNDAKVPQIFVGSQAATWLEDIDKYPWSSGYAPLYPDEGKAVAQHIIANRPQAKVGFLYQNDDSGKGYGRGLKATLAAGNVSLAAEQSYEFTDPTVDSQILALQASGADTLVVLAAPKPGAQAIRKAYDTGWRPQMYIGQVSTSVPNVLTPAGLDKSKGLISACYYKDPGDPAWANDKAVQELGAFMSAATPSLPKDVLATEGMCKAITLVQVIRQCKDDLTRENILAQLKRLDMQMPLFLPGVTIKTSDRNPHPMQGFRMQQFDGKAWQVI